MLIQYILSWFLFFPFKPLPSVHDLNHGISTFADLRIASKRAYYDNNKPYGESETITLYIYNAGPDIGKAPVVRAGYTYSMNYNSVSTTLRQAQTWGQPSQAIRYGTLTWTTKSSPTSRIDGWDAVTTLPDIPAGILMELSLSFPMTHETSYNDYTASASVSSSTTDPRPSRKSTTYIITPNHHGGGGDYWNTPGNLTNLDFNGLTNAAPLSQADLRIASSRARYNNNLPYGKSETLSFLVFNGGPTIASKPVVTASYTTSMDYDNMSCRGEQVWVPDGANPSLKLDNSAWHSLDGVSCRIQGWNVISSLPDIPPTALYRINFTFPMTRATTYQDYTGTASVSSQATELNPGSSSTSYVITPNHNNDGDAYWQARGNITQLDGPSKPSGSRACLTGWDLDTPIIASDHGSRVQVPLKDLEKWIAAGKSEVISYDIARKTLRPRLATDVEYGNSSQVTVLSFSADGKTELTYRAHPDTRLYLSPINIASGNDQLRLGYWIPVRMLWVGAAVRGMAPDGGTTLAYVTNVQQVSGGVSQYRSVAPRMVSQSHSYVVGTLAGGGILSHNPGGDQLCGDANVPAILAAVGLIANRLVATTTPRPDLPNPPHGYSLRRRRPTDRPPPAIPAPPVLPIDVPRRDENGNWLIYLYEEDTPGAVENARTSVVDGGQPWRLTYDPLGANARRRQSTGRYQSQRELLQLTAEELTGRTGTLGQLDRDEYPPAIASEGGAGAVVTYVEAGDNRRAGSLMGQQINNYRMDPQPDGHRPLRQGDTFRYVFIHNNMAGLEYLGDNVDAESQLERPPID